jgi:serine/threonine protein kinase/dienelactone hydrolase
MEPAEIIAEQIFGEALEIPREQRSAFLDGACRSAPQVRPMVEALLSENDRLSGFLSESPVGLSNGSANHDAESSVRSGPTPHQMHSLAPGTQLGRYSLIELLGSGGMGIVYRALDEKLERTVALKMLTVGVLNGDAARRHFRREALALAKLNHPNIAAVYDVGEHEGLDFIVMELVRGESLAERLRNGPLTLREATAIALEVSEALEEAQEQGVIHRDLKPANLMITPKGHVKVLDFGLAKLLERKDITQSLMETQGVLGTPQYMSPEQALGKPLDGRTDLWSLGALYYESLTGRAPFLAETGLAVLRTILDDPLKPLHVLRPDAPPAAQSLVSRALEKEPERRYQSAAEFSHDARALLAQLSGSTSSLEQTKLPRPRSWWYAAIGAAFATLAVAVALGVWINHRAADRRWARNDALAQVSQMIEDRHPLAAFSLLKKAQELLPDNPQLQAFGEDHSENVNIDSDPAGAQVEIQDYNTPSGEWRSLGTTPIASLRIPKGYFRWKISKTGAGTMTVAPDTQASMTFPLAESQRAPAGMIFDPGASNWGSYIGFLGWLGPYNLPPAYIDRFEVTNRDYQKFVDGGGYAKPEFWPATFQESGHSIPTSEAMARFRDTTGRPGPATWAGGHYPDGKGDFPVSGVSWFEASAYAAYAGKRLPVLSQWYQAASPDDSQYTVPLSNLTGTTLAPVGAYNGLGIYGTYDMAGNVREWIANPVDEGLRFILGGSWKSQSYLYIEPEALSPYDRSDGNGFRCVRNLTPLAKDAEQPFIRAARDFSHYKPVSDEVFRAYRLLYNYAPTPLNARVEGIVKETADWREEKVTFDTAYNNERMAAYLFLPKRVHPPYQTVLFFPSARVLFQPPDSSQLGDIKFFDYIVQSGRAVMYPVYQDTYERRLRNDLPGGDQSITITADWYKDAARSLDYLKTRSDIDSSRLAYLGVSMGAADGVIISTLLQDRLKTIVYLDGGFFVQQPPPGGDQADFAPRMNKPVLMVNGRYDYTFPVEKAQNPLFQMLGTPATDKSHVILDTPHDVTEQHQALVQTVLTWLDKYLGPVRQ